MNENDVEKERRVAVAAVVIEPVVVLAAE